jgi:hypothetical protein
VASGRASVDRWEHILAEAIGAEVYITKYNHLWLEDELFPQDPTIGWDDNATEVLGAALRVHAGLRQVFVGRVSVLGRGLLPADFGPVVHPSRDRHADRQRGCD